MTSKKIKFLNYGICQDILKEQRPIDQGQRLPAEPMKLKGGINVTVIKEQRYRQFVATFARLSVWRKTKLFETE